MICNPVTHCSGSGSPREGCCRGSRNTLQQALDMMVSLRDEAKGPKFRALVFKGYGEECGFVQCFLRPLDYRFQGRFGVWFRGFGFHAFAVRELASFIGASKGSVLGLVGRACSRFCRCTSYVQTVSESGSSFCGRRGGGGGIYG